MNRSSFLNACLAAGDFLTAPFAAVAGIRRKRIDKGIRVGAGKDRFDKPISLFEGDTFHTKVPPKTLTGICTFLNRRETKKAVHHFIIIMSRMNGGTFWRVSFYSK